VFGDVVGVVAGGGVPQHGEVLAGQGEGHGAAYREREVVAGLADPEEPLASSMATSIDQRAA